MVSVPGWQPKMEERSLPDAVQKGAGNLPSATRPATVDSGQRYFLKKTDILRGFGAYTAVFGARSFVQHGCARLFYSISSEIPPFSCRVGFAVRKPGNSVHRNRRRRLMKEAYRHERSNIMRFCEQNRISIDMVFLYDTTREVNPPAGTAVADIFRCLTSLMMSKINPTAGCP
jgi:RNase P protein component